MSSSRSIRYSSTIPKGSKSGIFFDHRGSKEAVIQELRRKYGEKCVRANVWAERDETLEELREALADIRKNLTRETFVEDRKREEWLKVQVIELVSQKISDLKKREKELEMKAEELEGSYVEKKQEQLSKVKEVDAEIVQKSYELEKWVYLSKHLDEPVPPGPVELRFVDSEWFMMLASVIIFMNVVTIVMETSDPQSKGKFFWPNQAFMVFYVCELTLKAILYRKQLLVGKPSIVWWNWLDTVIVCSGVLDMWIMPAVTGGKKAGGSIMSVLRVLRLARLVRLAALVKSFTNDLSWVDGHKFQEFMMSVIGLNAILMGFESDIPEFWGWFYVEQVLIAIFSFEVTVKLLKFGCVYFYHPEDWAWNWLDFIIVGFGIIDQWMMPLFIIAKALLTGQPAHKPKGIAKIAMMLRMLRLARILRLVRLLKSFPPLFTLIKGVVVGMEGMSWVVLLTFLLLYALAIPCVKLFGQGALFGGDPPKEVAALFPDVGASLFTLFNVMNGGVDTLAPLFEAIPSMKYVFMTYVIVSTWSILSILTAVVSEKMINSTNEHREEEEEEKQQKEKEKNEATLKYVFKALDQDKDGLLSEEELNAILQNQGLRNDLMDAAGMGDRDLQDFFIQLAHSSEDEQQVLDRERFIAGLLGQNNPVKEREIFRLEKRLDQIHDVLLAMKKSHVKVQIPKAVAAHAGE